MIVMLLRVNLIAGSFQIQELEKERKMSKTRFITVTPLQLCKNPKKYVPEQPKVNNIMRTFGRLKRMTEMKNFTSRGMLYELRSLAILLFAHNRYSVFFSMFWFLRWRVTAVGQ